MVVSGTVSVQDPFSPGATATRFGPVTLTAFPSSGSRELIPAVPDGSTFIVRYFDIFVDSNISGVYPVDGTCFLRLTSAAGSKLAGGIPLKINLHQLIGSEQVFLPVQAGEGLSVTCAVSPAVSTNFLLVAAGHFVPATD